MRIALAAALVTFAALTPAVPQGDRLTAHHPAPTDHGCSLYVSVPNPCDPDSNN